MNLEQYNILGIAGLLDPFKDPVSKKIIKYTAEPSLSCIGFDNSMKESKRVGGWDSTLPGDVYKEM